MKRKLPWTLGLFIGLVVAPVALKLTVPFSYAEAELRSAAIEFVVGLQGSAEVDPKECATRYLYFKTDYHDETPSRIRIRAKELSESRVRVTLHDPSCRDDSIHSSISRIYLQRNDDGIWLPTRHEWSHTGRRKLGWSTDLTN